MEFEELLGDHHLFKTKNGRECAMICFVKPNLVNCWMKAKKNTKSYNISMRPVAVKLEDIPIGDLKEIGIWKKISKDQREELEKKMQYKQELVSSRMAKARAGRRRKYPNMPREYECITCGAKQIIQPSVVNQRIEKKGILLIDFIKTFQCRSCKNRDKYKNVPDELTCKCGKTVKYHPSMIISIAKKKGLSVKDFIKAYKCRNCNPLVGRPKKKKEKKK